MDLLRRWDTVRFLCRLGVLPLVLAACGESRLADTGVVVRDSADVRIVESSRDREFRSLGWRISDDPDLVIGIPEGAEEYQLFAVEGAAVLPDGRIAVVNGGTQEVRFFDEEGRYIQTAGSRGDGPGEFQMPQLVRPVTAGGELLIWDLMLNRFTLLGPDGNVVQTVRPEAIVRTAAGWDGSGVVLSFRSSAAAGMETADGLMGNEVTFEGVPLDGGEPIRIAGVPSRVYHAQIQGQPWFRRIPFDPEPASTAGSGHFHVTIGSKAEVQTHDSRGDLVRLVRVLRAPDPLSGANFTDVVEAQLEAIQDEDLRRHWREHYGRMPVPETIPVYRGLLMDEGGYLWAEHFRVRPGDAPTWSVFDPDGAAIGTIQTPEGLLIYQVGEDFLVGRMRDDLGIERVVRFTLDRSSDES